MIATSITDPIAGIILVRDETQGTQKEIPYPNQLESGRMSPPPGCQFQTIEGLRCFQVSIPGLVDEGWISEDLQCPIVEVSVNRMETTSWRMGSIQRTEPPVDLFSL